MSVSSKNIRNRGNKMDSSLSTVLESFRVQKDDKHYTHTSRINPKGKFVISGKDHMSTFYGELCKANAKNEVYGLTEKPYDISPLRQDFDFRFSLDHGTKRVYTLDNLKTIHRMYCQVIKESVSNFTPEMCVCVVSEKSTPRSEDGVIKDGIHLFFPNLYCDGWFIDVYVPDRVTDLMRKEKLFAFEKHMEPINNLIDRKMATKVWMLYGSVSRENSEYYKVSHIFDVDQTDITIKQAFPLFFKKERPNPPSYYLPILMSIRKEKKPIVLNEVVKAKKKLITKLAKRKKKYVPVQRNEGDILEDLKRIDGDIMDMLSDERANSWSEWMDVGWTLFSISQGNEKALDMWIEFSKRSPKFEIGKCEQLWDNMDCRVGGQTGKKKTIGTILRLARLDSPDEYNSWRESNVEYAIEDSLRTAKPTDKRVAWVLYKCFEDRFVCSKSKGDMWFEYYNHCWHYVDDGIIIKKLLATIIGPKYSAYQQKLSAAYNTAVNGNDATEIKSLQDRMKRVWKVIEYVESESNLNRIVKMAKMFFYQEDFHEKLDHNGWLVGDQNGVFDLKKNKHRTGTPDDNISRQLGVPYIDYSWEDPDVVNAMDFIKKLFPNPNIREYFLKATSGCLQAGNIHKKCYVWTNESGNNGKSVMLKAMELLFGDYFLTFDPNRFIKTTIKSAGGPNPDIERIIGRRLGAAKELPKNACIDIGFFKLITGNDSIYNRSLHKEGGDIIPLLTMIIMCNQPPRFPGDDNATKERLRIIEFESTFCQDAPEDPEEQIRQKRFPMDKNFTAKLPDMIPALYWILLQYFKKTLDEGFTEPAEVKMSTDRYHADNDMFAQFSCDKIKKTGNPKDCVSLSDAWLEFQEWFRENYPGRKYLGSKLAFQHEVEKCCFGKINEKKKWVGFTVRVDIDDDGEESLGLASDNEE